jgi:hypothetical protein
MNFAEIKDAIKNGKTVHCGNSAYTVIKDKIGQYLIGYNIGGRNENYIGLTWQDGVTLNGAESDFFIATSKAIIHDLSLNIRYVVSHERECTMKAHKSAYQEFVRSGEVITMGKIIVEKA